MDLIPSEIIFEIRSFLTLEDVSRWSQVSTRYYQLHCNYLLASKNIYLTTYLERRAKVHIIMYEDMKEYIQLPLAAYLEFKGIFPAVGDIVTVRSKSRYAPASRSLKTSTGYVDLCDMKQAYLELICPTRFPPFFWEVLFETLYNKLWFDLPRFRSQIKRTLKCINDASAEKIFVATFDYRGITYQIIFVHNEYCMKGASFRWIHTWLETQTYPEVFPFHRSLMYILPEIKEEWIPRTLIINCKYKCESRRCTFI